MKYTTIEQSNKLLEAGLNSESADLCYLNNGEVSIKLFKNCVVGTPCWTSESLIELMPFHIITNNHVYGLNLVKGYNKDGETYQLSYKIHNTNIALYKTEYLNNLVDCCVDMILYLSNRK